MRRRPLEHYSVALKVGRRHSTWDTHKVIRGQENIRENPTYSTSNMGNPRVIYWFRTDLRLHDSPALKAGLDLNPEAFWPVWTWDPRYVYRARAGTNRWQFL
jgi:hypothetical protein